MLYRYIPFRSKYCRRVGSPLLDSSTKLLNLQDFAKSILDVADNLGRALEIVQKSSSSADDAEANAKLLKSLTEGVEMTDKQLLKVPNPITLLFYVWFLVRNRNVWIELLFLQVFEKHGLERFNPEGEPFDPNEHQAVYEVDDDTKTPGTVGAVLKVCLTYERCHLLQEEDDIVLSFFWLIRYATSVCRLDTSLMTVL